MLILLIGLFAQPTNAQQFFLGFEPVDSTSLFKDYASMPDSTAPHGTHSGLVQPKQLYALNLFSDLVSIPENTNQQWTISAFVKAEQLPTNALFVITLLSNDSMVYYHGIKLDDYLKTTHTWTPIEASFLLPADHNQGLSLKAYVWNRASTLLHFDAIAISSEELSLPSFIPDIQALSNDGLFEDVFANAFHRIQWNKKTGQLRLADNAGNATSFPIQWLAETSGHPTKNMFVTHSWKKRKSLHKADTTVLVFGAKQQNMHLELQIVCVQNQNKIRIDAQTHFNKKISLQRNSLVLNLVDSIHGIIRRNGSFDGSCLQTEYHLGNGGVVVGRDNRRILLHNSLQLSSVQTDTRKQQLFLNLDYAADHPLLRFPLLTEGENRFDDLSAASYQRGAKNTGSFSLFTGQTAKEVPLLQHVPFGYDAAFVWTEHADWTDLRTHRAVNLGHEDIRDAQTATGGFVGYGIPVTKSIFYANPDQITNAAASDSVFTGLHATLTTDSAFANLIDQLATAGQEICLHTPEQFTTKPEALKEALAAMKQRFGSPTWIDHGYNNKAENNRENMVCDGLDPESPVYARRLWKDHEVHYFWNPWYEEVNPWSKFAFNGHFVMPYPGFGDAFPVQMISQHPEFAEALMWGTTGTLEAPSNAMWDYYFHPSRIEQLIRHRAVYFAHVYPAWVKEGKGYWTTDSTGKIVAMPGFNRTLEKLNQARQQHKLLPATVQTMLDYHLGLRNIEITAFQGNSLTLCNKSAKTIRGITLSCNTPNILINGMATQNMRARASETLVWFDMVAGESVVISWTDNP